jgi:hypothetical protein
MPRCPEAFLKEACDRVELTRLSAIQKLEQVLTEERPKPVLGGTRTIPWDRDHRALLECVQTVTLAVAAEARELASEGIWTVVDVNREVEKFERNFAAELRKYDRPGRVLPSLVIFSASDRCDVLRPEVELELHTTNEWQHQHIAELAAIVDRSAKKIKPSPSAAAVKPAGDAIDSLTRVRQKLQFKEIVARVKQRGGPGYSTIAKYVAIKEQRETKGALPPKAIDQLDKFIEAIAGELDEPSK